MKNESTRPQISLENPPILQKTLKYALYGSNVKMKLYDNKIIYYKDTKGLRSENKEETYFSEGNNNDTYKGFISEATRRQLKKKLSIWIDSIETFNKKMYRQGDRQTTRPIFITLTLPTKQLHSDKEIKRSCLIPFIQKIRNCYGNINYFWRAEAQDNGNIHFHIITDRYMPRQKIHKMWADSLNVLGYMNRYKEKHGNKSDFTVKITGYGNYEALKNYVLKYCLKNEDTRPIKGSVWGASKPIKLLKSLTITGRNFLFQILKILRSIQEITTLRDDNFGVIFMHKMPKYIKDKIYKTVGYYDYMLFIYSILYNERHPNDLFESNLFNMNAFDIEPDIEEIIAQ